MGALKTKCIFVSSFTLFVRIGDDENIRTNMKLYGLESYYLDVLVTDFSRNVLREQPMFDAIITDRKLNIC